MHYDKEKLQERLAKLVGGVAVMIDLILFLAIHSPPEHGSPGTVLPESVGSVLVRSGRAARKRARRRTPVRRTSDAKGNAARADQGLPNNTGYPVFFA